MSLASLILSSLCVAGAEPAYAAAWGEGGGGANPNEGYMSMGWGSLIVNIVQYPRAVWNFDVGTKQCPTFSLGLNYNS
jgi:hypothetical protein